MKSIKIKLCAAIAGFLLIGNEIHARCWGEQCQPIQRFPYAMSAVVTQIYAS